MTHQELLYIEKTAGFVKEALRGSEAGHDWFHIERVWKNSIRIAATEKANLLIVQLGALLHDIADSKFHDGNENIGPQKARAFLESIAVDNHTINEVENIIRNISFKGGNFNNSYHSAELAIVQDADRLDAIGAIGITRAFHYGGFKNREIYNPAVKPDMGMDKESYKKSTAPTINHFYEKLLLLKNRMNTSTGKQMAEKRHQFMELFLEQFYAEWEASK